MILFSQNKVFCCSLGDSRAVLATSDPPDLFPLSHVSQFHRNFELEQMKKRRNSVINQHITPVPLTFDQKPDLPEEKARIVAHGGEVNQLKNAENQPVGPFRVFGCGKRVPGIAVSRALGDYELANIGIIAEPIMSMHCLSQNDFFIVVASDGVWDVMDNEDVVNFVENYRKECKRKVRNSVQGHLVNPGNSCIAQMLCEEARVRWFSLVKDEDVNIDDISCIIFELQDTPQSLKASPIIHSPKSNKIRRNSLTFPNQGENVKI